MISIFLLLVDVAQLVEYRIVIPVVAGLTSVVRPVFRFSSSQFFIAF